MSNTIKKIIPKSLREQYRLWKHKGDKYTCPICDYSSDSFFKLGHNVDVLVKNNVVGAGIRAAGCHKCRSNDRARILYVFLRDKTDFLKNPEKYRILHIAPEKHLTKKMLEYPFKEYVCGDLFTPGYNYPEHVVNMNVLDIPFEDNRFDLVICNHVLEHVEPDLDAMKEIRRVLKNGGKAILQVPLSLTMEETFEDSSVTDPDQRELVFGQYDHVRIYGQDYYTRLEQSGFIVEKINISKEYPNYGLNPKEDITYCTKND